MCAHVRVKNAKVESSLKELISKEMNNDNGLNLHLHDQIGVSGCRGGFATEDHINRPSNH